MSKKYDVIIVGAGPAGIFSALELSKNLNNIRILIVEKGKDITKRICPMKVKDIACTACPECAILSGWGGAGAFSDGKLTLSPEIGGFLSSYIDRQVLKTLIDRVDETYVTFGAPHKIYGKDSGKMRKIQQNASAYGLQFIPTHIRHIGTERCQQVLKKFKDVIGEKVDIVFNAEVTKILTRKRSVFGVKLRDGTTLHSSFVIIAPGREGSRWLEKEAKRLHLTLLKNPVDIGVRVEIPASVFDPLTKVTYEPKLVFSSKTFKDKVRTFCVNPRGEVVKEYLKGIWTVNGHSYAHVKSDNTNFALLVSTFFTEPFDEPILYGRYIAELANMLGKGVLVQRLGDLRNGRRSTFKRIADGKVQPTLKDAIPGDLSFAIPYRYLKDILEMLDALDHIAPGVNSDHTLLYGIEVKFYSMRPKLTEVLETEVANLFAVGDGAGVTRGLIQASASGILAAHEISRRSQ